VGTAARVGEEATSFERHLGFGKNKTLEIPLKMQPQKDCK
jgi:hypothetical protein